MVAGADGCDRPHHCPHSALACRLQAPELGPHQIPHFKSLSGASGESTWPPERLLSRIQHLSLFFLTHFLLDLGLF